MAESRPAGQTKGQEKKCTGNGRRDSYPWKTIGTLPDFVGMQSGRHISEHCIQNMQGEREKWYVMLPCVSTL